MDHYEQARLAIASRAISPAGQIERAIENVKDWQSGRAIVPLEPLEPGELSGLQHAIKSLSDLLKTYGLPSLPGDSDKLRVWLVKNGFEPSPEASWTDLAEIALRIQLSRIENPLPIGNQTSSDSTIAQHFADVESWANDIIEDRRLAASGRNTRSVEPAKLYRNIDQRKRDNPAKSARAEMLAEQITKSQMSM